MTTVGLAGLGRMGTALATHLAASDHDLVVYNRTHEKAEVFAAHHNAKVASSPAALGKASEAIITMLSDGPASLALFSGSDGLLAGLRHGALVINMATTGRDETLALGVMTERAGGSYVDAPVSGSVASAANAALTVLLGASTDAAARATPILDVFSQRIFHLGGVGTGTAMKLAVNSMLFGINQALGESLVLAERAGIDRSSAYDVFAGSAVAAPVVHYRREIFEFPGERPVTFSMRLAQKDLRLALDLASEVDAPMPQAQVNEQFMATAASSGWAECDMGDVARVLRGESAR